MSSNNYECPRCHNVFPAANKFLHDVRCTENKPVPLNKSRLVVLNEHKNRAPIEHRPQPKITGKRRPDSHIKPLDIKESVVEIPKTFNCWLCGQTFPEKDREEHMLIHQMQEENEAFKNEVRKQNQQEQQNNPQQNRPQQNRPQQNIQQQNRPQQNRPQQNMQQQNRPQQNMQQQYRPQQNQQQPPRNQPQKPPQIPSQQPNQKAVQYFPGTNLKRSFIPFSDLDIFDFGQIHEGLNKYDNPTDTDILNELPETEIDDVSLLDSERKNCIICTVGFKCGDKVTMLPCIHMFHTNCIQNWLKSKNFCPFCKMKLTKENLNK